VHEDARGRAPLTPYTDHVTAGRRDRRPVTSFGASLPGPETPRHGDREDEPSAPPQSQIDRLHDELAALNRELPELVDDAEDAAPDED